MEKKIYQNYLLNLIHNVIALPFKEHRVNRPKKRLTPKSGVSYDLQSITRSKASKKRSKPCVIMYYVALDVSLKVVSLCILNEKGNRVMEGEADSTPEAVGKFLEKTGFEIKKKLV
ncbi:MAG: hypothetical protein Tsb0015_14080 [Simkaniaceae bacterium]